MKKFFAIFKKVGGWDVLRQYMRGHVFLFAMMQTLLQGFSRKGLELVRLSVDNRLLCKLRKKYRGVISDFKATCQPVAQSRSHKVWVCWLQGMENAPELVQRCYRSLQENLTDREIVLLTEENYREYVTFPDYIQQKIDNGIITRTHFSDLLRLELLIHYGGTWIDATVLCTGNHIPSYMLDSELFVFQTLKPGLDGHPTCLSSWFMTACTNHPILLLTRDLLYRYWEKHTYLLDYFLLHDFFQLAIEAYPEEWKKVIPFSNSIPHILLLRLFEPYDHELWSAVQAMTPFHKLSYKFSDDQAALPDTYYQKLFK